MSCFCIWWGEGTVPGVLLAAICRDLLLQAEGHQGQAVLIIAQYLEMPCSMSKSQPSHLAQVPALPRSFDPVCLTR